MNRPRCRVILHWGMGADSTALLLRWIHQPEPFSGGAYRTIQMPDRFPRFSG